MNRQLGGARLGGMGTALGIQGEWVVTSGTQTSGLLAKRLLLSQVLQILQQQETG